MGAGRRQEVGRRGEQLVAEWYSRNGFEVLARNWRGPSGELDLVVRRPGDGLVVFCEVKTRTSDRFGSPFDAVTTAKARRLRRLAGQWLSLARPAGMAVGELRIDVAGVRPGPGGRAVVEVVEGACH